MTDKPTLTIKEKQEMIKYVKANCWGIGLSAKLEAAYLEGFKAGQNSAVRAMNQEVLAIEENTNGKDT